MSVVIRFSGDSGDGMQMVGNIFSESVAFAGYGVFTFPDYPAEVRAPQGTVAGVSGFQVHFDTQAVAHQGDKCDVLVAMNAAALVAHRKYATATARIILDSDNFTKESVEKVGYDIESIVEKLQLEDCDIVEAPITQMTLDAVSEFGLDRKSALKCRNMLVLGMTLAMYDVPSEYAVKYINKKFGAKNELVCKANIAALEAGEIDILVGTHALIEDRVQFSNLGLVIIDEQHRFGVEQRARLWTKNAQPPHILVMTATPIPRTLAMTLYGDLDVSVIKGLPPGRQPIKTYHYFESGRLILQNFMRSQIARGRQVYVVYPLIAESEKMDYLSLQEGFEAIVQDFPLPKYRVAVCHGKMKADLKQQAMEEFKSGQADILVATSVIEVGVDVPNATVIVIESAERFGLAQLHQLRGRVGRGSEQSYCVLMSDEKLSKESSKRLEAMCQTTDGFELAELDLKLRGAGDINGTMQSGEAFNLKIANPTYDNQILQVAQELAISILNIDAELAHPDHIALRELRSRYAPENKGDFSEIS